MSPHYDQYLSKVKSASLMDAMGRNFSHKCSIEDLISPTPGRILFGQVVTLNYLPIRQDHVDSARNNFASMFYSAIGDDGFGKVLVIASNGHHSISVGGGTKHSRLQNHKLNGLLTDGRLRDFNEFKEYDFAAYCSGEAVRWGGDIIVPYDYNVPVIIKKVTVFPGDYIYADSAAAIVIPESSIEMILQEAVKIEKDDAGFIEKIKSENPDEIRKTGGKEV